MVTGLSFIARSTRPVVLILGVAASAAWGQARPDLSGTWRLVPSRSDFGPVPGPTSRTDVIEHREPALTIRRTQTTAMGTATTTLVFAVDGEPHRNTVQGQEITSRLAWQADTLVVVSSVNVELPSGIATGTVTDRYWLSADGKMLMHRRAIAVLGQEVVQTMVLERADG